MTTGPDFDLAMTQWLADGPLRAPAGTVEAAIGIASRSSARQHFGSRLGRRVLSRLPVLRPSRGVRPAWALAALIAIIGLVAAGAAGVWLTDRSVVPPDEAVQPFASSSPSPVETARPAFLPSELVGTWSTLGLSPLTLTLRPCSTGAGSCGTVQMRDDNGETCTYDLVYRSRTTDVLTFDVGTANSFGCGYSPWPQSALDVRVAPDGGLRATLLAGRSPIFIMHRVEPRRIPHPRRRPPR